jgi:hypothetical protein
MPDAMASKAIYNANKDYELKDIDILSLLFGENYSTHGNQGVIFSPLF